MMNSMNSFLDKLFVKQILFLLQFVPLIVKCYTPGPLYAHTATLVGKRLYFIGGSQEKEFYYLDLSESFDISNANWKNLTVNAQLTRYNFATSVVYGGSIIFIGGKTTQLDDPFIYVFNTNKEEWVFPNTGIPPQQRAGFQAVINNGKIYIFVGSESDAFGKMIIFNLNLQDSIWSLGVNNNPPLARYGYTATLTEDGLILYIGGVFQNESYANMNEIPMYDTLKDNWSNAKMNPTGKIIPKGRRMHSAVLSKFNTIIVYGGYYYEVSSKPELVILDISNPIYNWIQPITGETLKSRWGHTSTYINSQMIVTFGIGFDEKTNSILSILSNPIKISFEITNTYKQPLESFAPNPNMPASPTISSSIAPSSPSLLLLRIIAIVIPIIIILVIIGFLVYYKRYKKQKAENENNNNNNTNNNSEKVQ